jgi:hypothetical protein
VCRERLGAEVCLVGKNGYRLEAKGLAPEQELRVQFGADPPIFVRSDSEGRVPGHGGGVAGYLPGDKPTVFTLMATNRGGEDLYVEMTMCGVRGQGRPSCEG